MRHLHLEDRPPRGLVSGANDDQTKVSRNPLGACFYREVILGTCQPGQPEKQQAWVHQMHPAA